MTDETSAAMAQIRWRHDNTNFAAVPTRDRLRVAMASSADVPLLLAAIEAVLKLADKWQNTPWPDDGGDRAGVAAEQIILDGIALRGAITTALAGRIEQ